MAKTIGIDIGYGHTKATDGKKTFIFPSVVADAVRLTFKIQKQQNDIKNFFATIKGREIFLGDLAIIQGDNPIRFKAKDRTEDDFTKEIFLSTLGLFCEGDKEEFNVVTGLPVDDFLRYKDVYTKHFIGTHDIEVFGYKKSITIANIVVVPQPFGAWCDLVFPDNGGINKEFGELHVGIIDVGYRTSDFIQINDYNYIEKEANTSDHGVSEIFYKLEKYINDEYGLKKEDFELEKIVNQKSIYTRQHGTVDLSEIIEEFSKGLATKIAKQIKSTWDNIDSLQGVYVTGGGGKMLYKHLAEVLGTDIECVESPQIANCIGYYKWGRSIFNKTAA